MQAVLIHDVNKHERYLGKNAFSLDNRSKIRTSRQLCKRVESDDIRMEGDAQLRATTAPPLHFYPRVQASRVK